MEKDVHPRLVYHFEFSINFGGWEVAIFYFWIQAFENGLENSEKFENGKGPLVNRSVHPLVRAGAA
jgi:hypothetical protein